MCQILRLGFDMDGLQESLYGVMIVNNNRQNLTISYKYKLQIRNMGGKESTPGTEQKDQISKVNHPRFQNIKFTRNQQEQDCIQVKLPVASIKEYDQWVASLKDAPTESENFLLPIKHQFKKEGFCGSSGFVNILFENFPYVLADQIRNRACLKQKFFDEPELWYLIYTLISAGHQFHKNGKKVGDVRPQNVFINEDGQVKVATQLSWPSQNTNYFKTVYQKQPTYLAPEQLRDIQFAKMQPSCNSKLAQSFSVGLTCLDAGILSSSNNLYSKNKFDYDQLEKKLEELSNTGYSQILCLVVGNLCETDADRRSTCSQLFSWLEPYQDHIINLERFQVNNLPEKLTYAQGFDQPSSSQRQSGVNVIQSVPQQQQQQPQVVTYVGRPTQSNYVNTQQPRQEEYHYHHPNQQGFIQGVSSHYAQPLQIQIPQNNLPPAVQISEQVNRQVVQPPQLNQSNKPQSQKIAQQFEPSVQGQQGQVLNSQSKTTTSTYTFTQYPNSGPVQFISSIPPMTNVPNLPYGNQNMQFSRLPPSSFQLNDGGVQKQKSTMDLTLQKIDEQLQMSRKMFPS